jgi:hypothetical protein
MGHIARFSKTGPWLKTFPMISNLIPFCGPNLLDFHKLNFAQICLELSYESEIFCLGGSWEKKLSKIFPV